MRTRINLELAKLIRRVLRAAVQRAGPTGRFNLEVAGIDVERLTVELGEVSKCDLESDLGGVETPAHIA